VRRVGRGRHAGRRISLDVELLNSATVPRRSSAEKFSHVHLYHALWARFSPSKTRRKASKIDSTITSIQKKLLCSLRNAFTKAPESPLMQQKWARLSFSCRIIDSLNTCLQTRRKSRELCGRECRKSRCGCRASTR
jgi:hypothetical protein